MGYFFLRPWGVLLGCFLPLSHIYADPSLVNVVLGRPTDTSMALNCLSTTPLKIRAEYGTESNSLGQIGPSVSLEANVPSEFSLTGLNPNTRYHYRLRTANSFRSIGFITPNPTADS